MPVVRRASQKETHPRARSTRPQVGVRGYILNLSLEQRAWTREPSPKQGLSALAPPPACLPNFDSSAPSSWANRLALTHTCSSPTDPPNYVHRDSSMCSRGHAPHDSCSAPHGALHRPPDTPSCCCCNHLRGTPLRLMPRLDSMGHVNQV